MHVGTRDGDAVPEPTRLGPASPGFDAGHRDGFALMVVVFLLFAVGMAGATGFPDSSKTTTSSKEAFMP